MFPMAVEYSLFGRKSEACVVNVFLFSVWCEVRKFMDKKTFVLIYETFALSTRILQ